MLFLPTLFVRFSSQYSTHLLLFCTHAPFLQPFLRLYLYAPLFLKSWALPEVTLALFFSGLRLCFLPPPFNFNIYIFFIPKPTFLDFY